MSVPSQPQNINYVRYPQNKDGWTLTGRWKGLALLDSRSVAKGEALFSSAAPTSSQPQTNLPAGEQAADCSYNGVGVVCYDRSFRGLPSIGRASGIYHGNRGRRGPLNPIKHWRKQLQPSQGHVTGKTHT